MAREIVTTIWCDICMDGGVKTEGIETPPITLGALKPRVLALCVSGENHMEIYTSIEQIVRDLGQASDHLVNATPQRGRPRTVVPEGQGLQCPLCEGRYRNRSSLGTHLRTQHQTNFGELEQQQLFVEGSDVPPEETPAPAQTRLECDLCGKVYEWPKHSRPIQALSVHKARTHDIPGARKGKKKAVASES